MLPKQLRLDPKLIPQIAYKGKKVSGKYFDIRIWHENGLEKPQFAISVSKKIDKRATIRNRIKRRLRAAIQNLEKAGKIQPAQYLILIRSAELAEKDIDVEEELATCISKIDYQAK